ncbi:hypothetical protein FHS21_003812 [Phyllobacterium trifolii]|uniref:Uncharacterized protein n=1 Tax=Phyllobacterium trifolii TaxID=300193 RepID=A0A839UEW7_9HYPH|nr:hypothetical protein [Phyllobacterium trifolii]
MEPGTATLMPTATWPVIVQPTQLPHGELVEPHTASLPSGRSALLKAPRSNFQTKKSWLFIHALQTSVILSPSFPWGAASGAVRKWGRTACQRAGNGPKRWPTCSSSEVNLRLQADIASIVDANANRADTAPTATMGPDSRRSSTRPAEQAEAGRQGENVSGRSSDRIPYLQRRASTTARLPVMQAMARRESGRGKGEAHPVL